MKWGREMTSHLKSHMKWPATKAAIVKMCNGMEHVPAAEKRAFIKMLPAGKYRNWSAAIKAMSAGGKKKKAKKRSRR